MHPRFHKDGTFRVLMISDFHAGKNCSPKLIDGIEALLASTKPDMVLVGGDQCLDVRTKEEAKAYMERIMEPVLRRGLPWAAVFGNHDRETGIPIELEQQAYEEIPGCVSAAGPEEISGTANFCAEILSAESDEPAFHVFGLDSHREMTDMIEDFSLAENTRFILPDHFNEANSNGSPYFDQVMWYYNESLRREKAAGKKIPAILFTHIGPMELNLIARNPEECRVYGHKREKVCTTEINPGLFMACLQRGDVKGIFCGHEHLCDFHGEYCGIFLGYDGAVGYNMSAHDDLRGGRVIDLRTDGTIQTHMVHLMDIMGRNAMRDPEYMEGGCNYFFRKL